MPDTTPTLRDRIAAAIRAESSRVDDVALADAVLAVLPEPPARQVLGTTDQQPEALPEFELRGDTEIRAAVLREAYEVAHAEGMRLNAMEAEIGVGPYRGALGVAYLLRRMADEAQQPCVHPQGYEGECPCPTSCVCCTATAADEAQQPEVVAESCGRFVPDTPRVPGLCASCGDARGWHSREAVEEQPAAVAQTKES